MNGARRALEAQEYQLAIQRAFYATQLLDEGRNQDGSNEPEGNDEAPAPGGNEGF